MPIKEAARWHGWMEDVAPYLPKKRREFWEGRLLDAGLLKSDGELEEMNRRALEDISRRNDVEVHDISEIRPGGALHGRGFGVMDTSSLRRALSNDPFPYITFPRKLNGRYFDTVDKVLRDEAAKADAAAAVSGGRASAWKAPKAKRAEPPEAEAGKRALKAAYLGKVRDAYGKFRALGMDPRRAYAEAAKSVEGGLDGVLSSMAEAPAARPSVQGRPSPFGGTLVITDRDGLTYSGGPMRGVRKLVDLKVDPLLGKGRSYGALKDSVLALHEGYEGVAYREKGRELEKAVRKALSDGRVDRSKVEDILTENFKRSQKASAEFAMKRLAERGDLEDILKFVPRGQLERYLAENFADRILHDRSASELGFRKYREQEAAKRRSIDLLGELAEKSRELQRLKAGGSLADRAKARLGGLLGRGGADVGERVAELERFFGEFNGRAFWDADPERFRARYRLALPESRLDEAFTRLRGNSMYDAYFRDPAQTTFMTSGRLLPSRYVPVGSHLKKDVLERERRLVRRHMASGNKVRRAVEGLREGVEEEMFLGGK